MKMEMLVYMKFSLDNLNMRFRNFRIIKCNMAYSGTACGYGDSSNYSIQS